MRCLVEGISVSEVGDRLGPVGISGMVAAGKDWSDEGQDLEKVETHFARIWRDSSLLGGSDREESLCEGSENW